MLNLKDDVFAQSKLKGSLLGTAPNMCAYLSLHHIKCSPIPRLHPQRGSGYIWLIPLALLQIHSLL